MLASIREREDDDNEARSPKRTKTTEFDDNHIVSKSSQAEQEPNETEQSILPPSHILLGLGSPHTTSGGLRQLLECDVGISEYITRDHPPVRGIIKQR
jgi:tRNA pseudouridine13 synthase